jgi:hypothetical protein
MKKLFTIICVLISSATMGQNYACVDTGVKHYFNNAIGYVRGIRIDSASFGADSVIYYPFKTERCTDVTNTYSRILDGGSWIGSKVTKKADGTCYFENRWGRNVVIKPQAAVSESWIFYEDTTDIYYRADVIAKSYRLIYGVVDSVKVIRIRTFNRDTGLVTYDPVNSLRITISENFGFYEVFDFYLFPHRFVGSFTGATVYDYFFDKSGPQQFRHVEINRERDFDLHNYAVGDIYGYNERCYSPILFSTNPYKFTYNFINSIDYPSSTEKVYNIHRYENIYCTGGLTTNDYFTTISTNGTPLNFIETEKMPEETGIEKMYYYLPDDSSLCYKSAVYKWRAGTIFNTFEPCESGVTYKMGFGLINEYRCGVFVFMYGEMYTAVDWGKIIGFHKEGAPCGTLSATPGFDLQIKPNDIIVYPNPANTEFEVKLPHHEIASAELYNSVGVLMLNISLHAGPDKILVDRLSTGIYTLIVTDVNGNRYRRTVSIQH